MPDHIVRLSDLGYALGKQADQWQREVDQLRAAAEVLDAYIAAEAVQERVDAKARLMARFQSLTESKHG